MRMMELGMIEIYKYYLGLLITDLFHTILLHSISFLRLELVVEPWIENLWPALESVFNLSYQDKTSQTNTPAAVVNDGVSPQTIVTAGISPTRGPSTVATKVPLTVKTPEIPVLTKTNGTSIQPVTTTDHDEVQIAIVNDLSDTVNTLLSLEYTDSSDTIVDFSIFKTTMRGSSDEAWKNQHIIVPSTQPSYLNVELKEVCVLYEVFFYYYKS